MNAENADEYLIDRRLHLCLARAQVSASQAIV